MKVTFHRYFALSLFDFCDLIASIEDILRPGGEVIASGYCMYGSATELVISIGHGVHQFTLDPSIGKNQSQNPIILYQ